VSNEIVAFGIESALVRRFGHLPAITQVDAVVCDGMELSFTAGAVGTVLAVSGRRGVELPRWPALAFAAPTALSEMAACWSPRHDLFCGRAEP
jgi:hypothetical protein